MQQSLVETPTLTWHEPIRPPANPAERDRLFPVIGWFAGTAQIGVVEGRKTVVIHHHSESRWRYRADIWLPGCKSQMAESLADAMAKAEVVVAQFIKDNPGHWDGSEAA